MSQEPAHIVRFGFIKITIWENKSRYGGYTTVPIRLYKDGDAWRESTRFARDDLLLLAKAADTAHTWICDQGKNTELSRDDETIGASHNESPRKPTK